MKTTTMEKKIYKQPQFLVIEVKAADIICTSSGTNTENLTEEDYVWGA